MKHLVVILAAALLTACAPAMRDRNVFTLRGTVTTIAPDGVTVRTKSGQLFRVRTTSGIRVQGRERDTDLNCLAEDDRIQVAVTVRGVEWFADRIRAFSGRCLPPEQ